MDICQFIRIRIRIRIENLVMVLQDINDKFGEYCEGKKVLYHSMVAV